MSTASRAHIVGLKATGIDSPDLPGGHRPERGHSGVVRGAAGRGARHDRPRGGRRTRGADVHGRGGRSSGPGWRTCSIGRTRRSSAAASSPRCSPTPAWSRRPRACSPWRPTTSTVPAGSWTPPGPTAWRAIGRDWCWVGTVHALGELAAALGDRERGAEVEAALLPFSGQFALTCCVYVSGSVDATLGRLARLRGDEAEAQSPARRPRSPSRSDHVFFAGDADALVDEIEAFATGEHPGPSADRVLRTLLFTDVVGSTDHAAAVGDRAWKMQPATGRVVEARARPEVAGVLRGFDGVDGGTVLRNGHGAGSMRCHEADHAARDPAVAAADRGRRVGWRQGRPRVRARGLEPPRGRAPPGPKPGASSSSATPAWQRTANGSLRLHAAAL